MSSLRGLANHSLYMARIQLAAWQSQLDAQTVMASALDAAFAPAVRLHLLDAYGWFLLATARVTQAPESPPHTTAALPDLGKGLAIPGEIDEYAALERNDWLGRLQQPLPTGLPKRSKGPMLAMSSAYPHISDYAQWCDLLEALFQRVGSGLDES